MLGLISLLTHNQIFWIAALLLAMSDIPSLLQPLTSMSRSLHRLSVQPARRERRRAKRSLPDERPEQIDKFEADEVTVTATEEKKDA